MPFGCNNVKSTSLTYTLTQFNIGAAASHIGGNRDMPRIAGKGDDVGFLLETRGVEHARFQTIPGEHVSQLLAGGNITSADKDGSAQGMHTSGFFHNCLPFGQFSSKIVVGPLLPTTGAVWRDSDNRQT